VLGTKLHQDTSFRAQARKLVFSVGNDRGG
jgi:hypothetical protein